MLQIVGFYFIEACRLYKYALLITSCKPENLRTGFLLPDQADTTPRAEDNFDTLVRLMVSYDMGWSTRGSGRNYDSLGGYGVFIGTQSSKIIEYATRNRKCRLCDNGHPQSDHDCRLNFSGSAKAMEADAAAKMITESTILKNANVEVGIVVGDDDSSTIAAIRRCVDHPVVKFSDRNHTSKGVIFYIGHTFCHVVKISHKELTSDAIKYLKRCFGYALSQHIGNSTAMANAIRQIPHHAFNNHENCGAWCSYQHDPENYTHTSVPGGFQSSTLYTSLKQIFNQLANNSDKFAHGFSSQANESINHAAASKAPKAQCYSQSESADFRFAAVVGQKNRGEKYIADVTEDLKILPATHLLNFVKARQRKATSRAFKMKTQSFKRRRQILKKFRAALRNKKETREGITYESNMGLIESHALDSPTAELSDEAVVFYDLETSSLARTAEILQIGARYNDTSFGKYINPTRPITSCQLSAVCQL